MQRRVAGRIGEELSIIGFGGIVVSEVSQEVANEAVARAVAHGINYFDVAPSYGDAEVRLGPALEPYRNQVFLACKTHKRDAIRAREELENSLRELRTDHFDLYQLHAMTTEKDFAEVMGPNGALETLVQARQQGLIRHIGFSAHSAEIAEKLMDAWDFDSILFPVNYIGYLNADFGPRVMEKAREKNMARFALKAMARTRYEEGQERRYAKCWYDPIDDPKEADLALRFTLSEPITAALPPGDGRLFDLALSIARDFVPLSFAERQELAQRAAGVQPMFSLAN